jgi:DNA-directed RNA polymerase sigma subunit (sigma70/sigma32)
VASYWATDDGWPYRDAEPDVEDPAGTFDDDLLSIRLPATRLLDRLDPLERQVIAAHYGLDGPARSMKQLRADMGLPQAELRQALGSGLVKLRTQLSS